MRVHTKLWVSVILCVGLLMSITCVSFAQAELIPGGQYNLDEYEKLTGKRIESFDEAPNLRVKVAAGELPSVEKRLPGNPVVIEPIERIGQYGGTWRRYEPAAVMLILIAYEPLVRWGPDAKSIEPNIAEKWKVSEDGKSITFFLRKGIKWSDGYPFTADDIMFYYESVFLNDELTPAKPTEYVIGEEIGKFEKLDDYTFRVSFSQSYGLLLYEIAKLYWGSARCTVSPKHYLKEFHPQYTSVEKLESMVKEAGFEHWYELFTEKSDTRMNPELPTLHAWVAKTAWGPRLVKAERNPYYWKVDPDGNQLPYIDELSMDYTTDWDSAFLKVMTGQSEMQGVGHKTSDYPLYMENREKGDYRVFKWPGSYASEASLMLNQTHKDSVLRKIFRDVRFRQALSLAVDREEINEIVFLGMCPIGQATICPQSPFYEEEFDKVYVEYDPDRANRLLDEMGLKWDKEHQWRLRPDGERLEIVILLREHAIWIDTAEIIKKQYEDIGVQIINQTLEASLWHTRVGASEHDATIQGCAAVSPVLVGANTFLLSAQNNWGKEWAKWRDTKGEAGEEPVEDVLKIFQLYDKYKTTVNEDERIQLGTEIMSLHAKNLWIIGLGGKSLPYLFLVKNSFRNFPDNWLMDEGAGSICRYHPEQCFIE